MNEENEDLEALREEITAWQGLNEKDKTRSDLPERLYHSLNALISPDPNLRPSAEDILIGIEKGIGEEVSPLVCMDLPRDEHQTLLMIYSTDVDLPWCRKKQQR
jgi:hypothetical protein